MDFVSACSLLNTHKLTFTFSVQAIIDASKSSMGMDISPIDLLNIDLFASRVIGLTDYRKVELSRFPLYAVRYVPVLRIKISLYGSLSTYPVLRIGDVYPGYEFFPSRIKGRKDSRIRIRIKELSILAHKIVSKLSEIWLKIFIPDPDLGFSLIPDPGVKKTPDPGTLLVSVS